MVGTVRKEEGSAGRQGRGTSASFYLGARYPASCKILLPFSTLNERRKLPAARTESSSDTTRNPTASGSFSSNLSSSEETCTVEHECQASEWDVSHPTPSWLCHTEEFLSPPVPQFPYWTRGNPGYTLQNEGLECV